MYFIKIAVIIVSLIVLPLYGFSKPNPQLKEQKIKSQLEFVQHLIDRGEAKDALSLLEGLNQEYPEEASLLEVLSHFYFSHGDYPRAAFYFDKLYQVDPSQTPALLFAAQSHAHQTNYPAAIQNYKLYLQHHPEDATIWKNLGLLSAQTDDIDGATRAYLKAFSAKHSSLKGEDHLQVAQWFLELENRKRAREFFSYALKEKEARERALVQLIDLDLKEHKFANAKQKLNILKGLNKDALTLYPIQSIEALIEDAEATAHQVPTVTAQSSQEPTSVEPLPALPSTLATSFDSEFRFELPSSKHRALLEPLPMQTTAESPGEKEEDTQKESLALESPPVDAEEPEIETAEGDAAAPAEALNDEKTLPDVSETALETAEEPSPAAYSPEDLDVEALPPTEPDAAQASLTDQAQSPINSAEALVETSETLPQDDTTLSQNLEGVDPALAQSPEALSLEDCLHTGATLEHQEAYSQALDFYLKALESYPKSAELLYRVSRVYFRLDHLEEAKAQAFQAMKYEPHVLSYTFHYLKIAQRSLPPESFILQLQKAKGRFPEVPELSLALARCYEHHLQNMNQAIIFYKAFLDEAPADHPKRQEAEEALERLL